MSKRTLVLSAVCSALFALTASAWSDRGWTWTIPDDTYANLEFTYRAAVDRAIKIFREADEAARRGIPEREQIPRFRAAANEWKKIQIQAETDENVGEDMLAYVSFMQAYSLYRARDKNESIKLFAETKDLYPADPWAAVAAQYFIGEARCSMGDTRRGGEEIEVLCDDAKARTNPLQAIALNRRANRLWNAHQDEDAIACWLDVRKRFISLHRDVANDAWYSLRNAYAVRRDMDGLTTFLFAETKNEDVNGKLRIVGDTINWTLNAIRNWNNNPSAYFVNRWPKKSDHEPRIRKCLQSLVSWAEMQRPLYAEADKRLDGELVFLDLNVALDPGSLVARVQKLVPVAKAEKDTARVTSVLTSLAWRLFDGNKFPEALSLCDQIPDRPAGLWMKVDMYGRRLDVKNAVATLDQIPGAVKPPVTPALMAKIYWRKIGLYADNRVRMYKEALAVLNEYEHAKPGPEASEMSRIKWTKVDCYCGLADWDNAVKTLNDIGEPPRTLWRLADVYRSAGKKKESYNALTEIASIFPDDAPAAVYRSAQWKEQDGDKKTAIALYRRLLSQPEWKTRGESSRAHQDLERLGEKTGGAMTNTVR